MTTYRLTLTSNDADDRPGRILASLNTEVETVMAATLRAVADRLDPPRPTYRSPTGTPSGDLAVIAATERRGMGRDAEGFPLVHDPDDRPRCPAVHANGRKCIRAAHGDSGHKLAYAIGSDALRWDAPGGVYVHDADCNTIHDAGPDSCPPPRWWTLTPAQIDAMVCPNCIGDAHTYEAGKCAPRPPWNGGRFGLPVQDDGKAPGTTP